MGRAVHASLLILLLVLPAWADSWEAKTDNEVICLDARTGKLLWTHTPAKLSDAHFEWHDRGVVMFPHYDGANRTKPVHLDPATGKKTDAFQADASKAKARSGVFWPLPKIELANGWRLRVFNPGNDKSFVFEDKSGDVVWKVDTKGYPHRAACWKNLLYYAFSYMSDEGVIHALEAGAKEEAWAVDLNDIVTGRKKPLARMIFQVIDDELYVEANEHLFCFEPATGKLVWHRDLSKDLGLSFDEGLFGGALNLAVFAKTGDILIVSFEKRVIAIDLKKERYLWHLEPDTFPHCPFPVAHGGKVVLTSGSKRKLSRVE